MDLSNIKKIISEEGKVVVVDGDNALVVMSYEEYKRMKQPKQQGFLLSNETKPVDLTPEKLSEPEIQAPSEKPATDLTLDDLPF